MSDKQVNSLLLLEAFQSLLKVLAPQICQELMAAYGAQWWQTAVLGKLYEDQQRELPTSGDPATLVKSLDIQRALILFDVHWGEIFRKKFARDNRTWAKELSSIRNRLAHLGSEDINDNDTWRALDTMARLCEQMDSEKAEEIRSMLRKFHYGSADGSTASPASRENHINYSPSALPPWREVMEPHPDVARGRYRNAEFAADLAQVARGEAAIEYQDPVEFFGRTYITIGMQGLLKEALQRVAGMDVSPVIQLKTAFGGGKTHSMLALYHLLGGKAPIAKIPAIKSLLANAGLEQLPKAHIAVIVGTALDPSRAKRPPNLPGVTVNTIWGEIAAQLAISAGKPELYDIVKESDKKGVSPGSENLKKLFDAAGPCLILMDELVAYAKRIYGVNGLPAGTYDNFISFIQEIGEAARDSKSTLVVASIPESEIEVGGEAGQKALKTISHTFGRVEAIWTPVAANEGFEVVRRRLFLDCKNPEARDMVCAKFAEMYNDNPDDFPVEAKEVEYRNRLEACYPIHPEVFDRLYEDWATLERFQRTRGVLRLMAAVIHELWMGNDQSLLILPASLPLDVPNVRDELTRHIPDNWNAILEREVDGKHSSPFLQDRANPRYGKLSASRRVARTIMLGSAPDVRQQRIRGIASSRIRLGAIQPGEPISSFNDALNTLQNNLAYLYSSQDRFWYDTRPTLRKAMEDRATQIAQADIEVELEKRLRKRQKTAHPLAGIHTCPSSPHEVADEQTARLVILPPGDVYVPGESPALTACAAILDSRGNAPRTHKNMLVFLAPDKNAVQALVQETRRYCAWLGIHEDREALNLDSLQIRETKASMERSSETVDLRIDETWCWLVVPVTDPRDPKKLEWQVTRLEKGYISTTAKKLERDEAIITSWAPSLLLMELDNLLWKDRDHLSVGQLWEYLTTYLYLPRLRNFRVLEDAIRQGVQAGTFALASGFSDGHYDDLKYQNPAIVDMDSLLVRSGIAKKQLDADAAMKSEPVVHPGSGPNQKDNTDDTGNGGKGVPDITPPKNKRFYLSANLDFTRINSEVPKIVEEILHYLARDGSLEISLEVQAHSPAGFEARTEQTVKENCTTLKIDSFGFEKE